MDSFDATVEEVEDLLYAEFYIFEHSSGSHDISTESYHIPGHIQDHTDYVTPGTRLRMAKRSSRGDLAKRNDRFKVRPQITKLPGFPVINATSCNVYVTADCTRSKSNSSYFWIICYEYLEIDRE